MRRCKHRLSWNDDWRCHDVGWLFGRCVDHFLERCRWEIINNPWLLVNLDLGNVNRPYIQVDDERPIKWISFEYGNRGSDPVFMLVISRRGQR